MLKLVCGNPNEEGNGAAFSRFVLPFSYRLESIDPGSQSSSALLYRPVDPGADHWRRTYLTEETAGALFDRAKWFEVEPERWPVTPFNLCLADGRLAAARLSPPVVVLFEFPEGKGNSGSFELLRTGFLILDVWFPEQGADRPLLGDLLDLNELFRYWRKPFDGHQQKKGYQRLLANLPLGPDAGSKPLGDAQVWEMYLPRWAALLEIPLEDGGESRRRIVPEAWSEDARRRANDEDGEDGEHKKGGPPPKEGVGGRWDFYADNRAFVWTCALLPGGAHELPRTKPPAALPPHRHGYWVKLVNVDPCGDPAAADDVTDFEAKWAKDRTYARWAHHGTWYGFSYHGGAMLGPCMRDLPLWRHFSEMYFDQVLLLLYIRCSVFRFSQELSRISGDALSGDRVDRARWRQDFQDLRWAFTLFTNLYQFPLLSNQEQAVEMYTIARKALEVDELFREVQAEIQSSHDYLMQYESGRQTEQAGRLNRYGAVLGLAAIVLSFLQVEDLRRLAENRVEGVLRAMEWPVSAEGLTLATVGVLLAGLLTSFFVASKVARSWKDAQRETKERS